MRTHLSQTSILRAPIFIFQVIFIQIAPTDKKGTNLMNKEV